MRMLGRVALTTALLVPMVAAPVAAQNYRWDFGVNGGYSWYRAMLGSDDTGLQDGTDRDDVKFEAGWLVGSQLGIWLRPKLGLRANFAFAERPVVAENYRLLDGETRDDNWFTDVNLWSGSVDLLFRFSEPRNDWGGREVLPYLALGLGAKWINPGGDEFMCVEQEDNEQWTCHPFTVAGAEGQGNSFALGERRSWMGLIGLGTDIRLSPNFALRLEASDRIYRPHMALRPEPVENVQPGDNIPVLDNESQIVHEIGGQIGLHMLMGLMRPQVVTIAPTPAAPPPPPPAAPREEAVTVCVIDPTAPSGIRMQTAYYRVEERDTVVRVGDRRVPLRESVGNVMVARDADWYVRGQPLTLNIGDERIEYLTYQGARQIEGDRLAYLGTVNGYPVYADRDEVADVTEALNTLREAERDRDLGEILAERRDVRDELEDVEFLYVPLEPTGCVFQTLQMLEPVTKGKK